MCVDFVSIVFQEFRSGATAVVSLIREKKLYVGWVGDSQACLVRKGESQQLVVPHKPDREVRIKLISLCVLSTYMVYCFSIV